jgi:hypothetical protein
MPHYPYECTECHQEEFVYRRIAARNDCPASSCCGAPTERRLVRQVQLITARLCDSDMWRPEVSGKDLLAQENDDMRLYEETLEAPMPDIGELQTRYREQQEKAGVAA